ncbi:META domain-containing protein [Herbiconiux solani]|uniref:META domain-containing protein n=1 Tax=Herbiconiux solani TaxID=661329 RepID=UPI0008245453|nr:META domain-containing protein [Herbiconiux solani]
MTTLHPTAHGAATTAIRSGFAALGLLAALSLSGCSTYAEDAAAVVTGTWSSDQPPGAELTLGPDGKVTGSDGCNSLSGTWSAGQKGVITLAELSATEMFCEGVDTWLTGAATLTIADGVATVADQAGTELGTLHR